IPDHLAGGGFVVDNGNVGVLAHGVGSLIVNVDPCPGPALSAASSPPCISMIFLTMERPSPVELSPPVGLADRRWKRPNSRLISSGDSPGPSSVIRIASR